MCMRARGRDLLIGLLVVQQCSSSVLLLLLVVVLVVALVVPAYRSRPDAASAHCWGG